MGTYDSGEREYWESLTDAFPCLVHHLKTIEINGFMGGGSLDYSIYGFMGGSLFENMVTSFNEKDEQMELLKFLLKNAGACWEWLKS